MIHSYLHSAAQKVMFLASTRPEVLWCCLLWRGFEIRLRRGGARQIETGIDAVRVVSPSACGAAVAEWGAAIRGVEMHLLEHPSLPAFRGASLVALVTWCQRHYTAGFPNGRFNHPLL